MPIKDCQHQIILSSQPLMDNPCILHSAWHIDVSFSSVESGLQTLQDNTIAALCDCKHLIVFGAGICIQTCT